MSFSRSALCERCDDGLHDWRTNAIAEKSDAVPASAHWHEEAIVEAHRASELGNLKHADFGTRRSWLHQGESIDRGNCAQRSMKGLPAPRAIRSVVDEQEAGVVSQLLKTASSPVEGGLGPVSFLQMRGTPSARGIEN